MLSIPLYEVFHLQMTWMKKFSVALMFVVGTLLVPLQRTSLGFKLMPPSVTVVSILRLRSLIAFGGTSNVTWEQTNVVLWSVYEINVGIIYACMPALRLILIRAFPMVISTIQGSTQRSSRNHHEIGGRAIKRNVDTIGSAKSGKESLVVEPSTITCTTTFAVQHEESDEEAELVHMENLSEKVKRKGGDSYTSELGV
jgi:hypothetical protein